MPDSQFEFDGYGIGVSGDMGGRPIEARLIAALPRNGGYSSDTLSNFRLNSSITINHGRAEAAGSLSSGAKSWQSLLDISLEQCELTQQIYCEKIQVRLSARHFPNGGTPEFSAIGSSISGLSIQGRPVAIEMEPRLDVAKRRLPGSLVTNIEARGNFVIDGNTISVPPLGRIRLAELEQTSDHVRLTMFAAELDAGDVRGQLVLASATLGGTLTDSPHVSSPARKEQGEHEEYEVQEKYLDMDEDDFEECVKELVAWAATHPRPREPFMTFMGKVLSPVQFVREVETHSRIGKRFLTILLEQSRRSNETPQRMIHRTVEANRP